MFDLNTFEELVRKFGALPQKTTSITFMEIAGYPHYENVCSNILAFYLDPEEVHGLGDLLLQAFFRTLKIGELERIAEASVSREVFTDGGKRLDLLIDSPTFVMGIENKIWAPIYNDLSEYSALIESRMEGMNGSTKPAYRVVLALAPIEQSALSHGFVSMTHSDWITNTRDLLGHYAGEANPKYLTYLIDFMSNIEAHTKTPTDSERIKFFVEHGKQLAELTSEYQKFLNEQFSTLRSLVKPLPKEACRQWVWDKRTLVHDITPKEGHPDKYLSVDTTWTPDGWYIEFFCRPGDGSTEHGCRTYFKESLSKLPKEVYAGFEPVKRGYFRSFPADRPAIEVASILNPLLEALYASAGYKMVVA